MIEYLSATDFARAHDLDPGTIRRYRFEGRLPEPDVVIGVAEDARRHYGWLRETVEGWRKPGS